MSIPRQHGDTIAWNAADETYYHVPSGVDMNTLNRYRERQDGDILVWDENDETYYHAPMPEGSEDVVPPGWIRIRPLTPWHQERSSSTNPIYVVGPDPEGMYDGSDSTFIQVEVYGSNTRFNFPRWYLPALTIDFNDVLSIEVRNRVKGELVENITSTPMPVDEINATVRLGFDMSVPAYPTPIPTDNPVSNTVTFPTWETYLPAWLTQLAAGTAWIQYIASGKWFPTNYENIVNVYETEIWVQVVQ